jgi:hypothetical protein
MSFHLYFNILHNHSHHISKWMSTIYIFYLKKTWWKVWTFRPIYLCKDPPLYFLFYFFEIPEIFSYKTPDLEYNNFATPCITCVQLKSSSNWLCFLSLSLSSQLNLRCCCLLKNNVIANLMNNSIEHSLHHIIHNLVNDFCHQNFLLDYRRYDTEAQVNLSLLWCIARILLETNVLKQ